MRWSISLPQQHAGGVDDGLRAYVQRAEELGFEGIWTYELTLHTTPVLAPLEMLAWTAALTTRVRLGVGVLVSSRHEPLQLASAITAVDVLSGGRLDVGVAPGGAAQHLAAFGADPATFVASFTEGLALMKAAWADDERITVAGRFRHVEDVPVAAKPVQRPHPPVWFGGSAPAALARAVRHGDAFLGAGSTSTARFAEQVAFLRRELGAAFPIAKRVHVAVDDDAVRAREDALTGLRRIYARTPGIEDVPVTGTPDDVARGLGAVRDAGAEMVVLNPVGADVAADRTQMERLAREVLPAMGERIGAHA